MPLPFCEGGPFGCRSYQSVGGRDSSGELAWLQSQPLVVSTVFVNGTWTVGVKTPCNGLGVEVDLQGDQLIPGEIIATAVGCLGPESGYEAWTHELFRLAVTWTRDGQSLVLRNSHGTVEFRDSGPNPNL
ncbi:META domain-containing protein [Arthrobacter sp. CG_A4]|uniref:META domain-containing protein n=1 Tax=Arthrobacter sp. CG_A4 TaxID=3071706 RepID=UPI003FA36405